MLPQTLHLGPATYEMAPDPVRGQSPSEVQQPQQFTSRDNVTRSSAGRTSGDGFYVRQFERFSQDAGKREGSSKSNSPHYLYAEKMADSIPQLGPVDAAPETANVPARGHKEEKYASEESQKIDLANEELMRFRKLRQSLKDGVY